MPAASAVEIAVGEVGPPDALRNSTSPPNTKSRAQPSMRIDDVPRRVPGNLDDAEGEAGEFECFAVVEQPVGRRAARAPAERAGEVARRIGRAFEASPRPIRIGRPRASALGGPSLPAMWSEWPWVSRIAAGTSPCASIQSMTASGSNPGSRTRHSVPPGRTEHVAILTERRRLDAGDYDVGVGGQQFSDGHGKR
jgi:hypothetical protein